MRALELKLPPVPLALAIGGLMWLAAGQWPALAFVLLQIAPEERALAAKFGAEFVAYARAVPRWL